MDSVENPKIIPCAMCLQPTGAVWAVTSPRGFIICGDAGCEHRVTTRGERIFTTSATIAGRMPARPAAPHTRKRATCDHCHQWLPTARRHQFISAIGRYCTLSCLEAARKL